MSLRAIFGTASVMDILLLSSDKKIQSALNEDVVGSDSLLVPMSYWNQLDKFQRKALSRKLPFLLRRYTKYVVSLDRLHWRGGKIKYNWGVGELKKMTIHVNSGVWIVLGALAAAHGVSRCYLFNYLLWLEEMGIGDSIENTMNREVPQFHDIYKMIWTLDLRKNLVYRELYFEPNPLKNKHTNTFPPPDL
ncbi:DUF1564 domain-containing protein [Leptospira borgpetersenii serovar Hardjo-bovis]|nr:DUF1564 domain-containing protein [Leptospira borgpetersenii]ABJ79696.1 Hypothetical protein LBL_2303 [Leptospira borgpetersenii serovar Hardjo-bovis str. L550]AMX59086.1 hypothetical protein LBK6_12295 [Leptospira borgpetersenii serovar Hardjo]AMX62315.1 hypothetical protein LBK9_12210 [Leptospira borgpetersenii serovar Hardjo]AMX65557.1 hypothetical protein LBK30_12225 [Leptospira borgpetersenii serovar Hardjo]AMX68791.1 hypothetical protein LBHA_12180 [Leptospira borgpetersenii serovar H